MPGYVLAEPMGDSSSLLVEKFLVSFPVLTSLFFGVLYIIYQLLELDEDLLLDLNSGQDTEAAAADEQSRAEPAVGEGAAAAAEGEPLLEEDAEGGGGGGELDPQEEGLFEELARKFGVLCMLLEEALLPDRYESDSERSGIEPTTNKKKKKDERNSKTIIAEKKDTERCPSTDEQHQVRGKTDPLSENVGKLCRPHLVTSVDDNGFVVVVSDDVTAIPVQVVPSSVEISVAPADNQQVGEHSCGCCAAAAVAARRSSSACQRCRSKSGLRSDELSERLRDDDDATPEVAGRALQGEKPSTLGFRRQTMDVEALIGRLRKLLCQHDGSTGPEDDDRVCPDCDVVEVFPGTAGAQECLADRERRRRSFLCSESRDVPGGSYARNPGQCVCVVVKLDRNDFDTAPCRAEAARETRRSRNANVSPRVLVETPDGPKTTPTRCGCSHLPHASRNFAPRVIIVSENQLTAD